MTDTQIIAEFLRIEAIAQNALQEADAQNAPQGADYAQIMRAVADMSGRPLAEVMRLILDTTFSQPN